ncbi:hypothetical protein EDD16DRAFT_1595208 [Pisolithus croceorrhizus]|nr:hypothetical protein EDD16DRAFT_1595208 [Pisolithus croceorrhizus]
MWPFWLWLRTRAGHAEGTVRLPLHNLLMRMTATAPIRQVMLLKKTARVEGKDIDGHEDNHEGKVGDSEGDVVTIDG